MRKYISGTGCVSPEYQASTPSAPIFPLSQEKILLHFRVHSSMPAVKPLYQHEKEGSWDRSADMEFFSFDRRAKRI